MLFTGFDIQVVALVVLAACSLDLLLGEVRRFHPLVGFGALADKMEALLNRGSSKQRFVQGALGSQLLALCCALILGGLALSSSQNWINAMLSTIALYFCIGWRSLEEHSIAVFEGIESGVGQTARDSVGQIVSRDVDSMSQSQVCSATIESVLENGSDAVIAPIFWFVLLGPMGAVYYRCINTLDAMWGYKTPQFLWFGRVAAKADDLLNWIPARITALAYCLVGKTRMGLQCWRQQAGLCASPNGGPTMCAGAGALAITIGGPTSYHGEIKDKPFMGQGVNARVGDIKRANNFLRKAIMLCLVGLSMPAILVEMI